MNVKYFYIIIWILVCSEAAVWIPPAGTTWQWQLSGTLDTSVDVTVYDVDLFETTSEQVKELHSKGRKVFCYISVGSYEKDRPDSAQFPSNVIGKVYPGWEDEKFIDTRSTKVREIMAKRLDLCHTKGFDGIEPDNIDSYTSSTGFPLNENTAVDYGTWLASEAHNRNLSIGQKNAPEIASKLNALFDWALTESCGKASENWCSDMKPYTDHNKAIFAAEYDDSGFSHSCSLRSTLKLSPLRKHLNLDKWFQVCVGANTGVNGTVHNETVSTTDVNLNKAKQANAKLTLMATDMKHDMYTNAMNIVKQAVGSFDSFSLVTNNVTATLTKRYGLEWNCIFIVGNIEDYDINSYNNTLLWFTIETVNVIVFQDIPECKK